MVLLADNSFLFKKNKIPSRQLLIKLKKKGAKIIKNKDGKVIAIDVVGMFKDRGER